MHLFRHISSLPGLHGPYSLLSQGCLVPVRSASGGVILEGGRGEQWGQEENEGSETPDTLSEAFSEAALAFKQDNNRQLPEPPTCLDTFNRTVDHNMSVPISSAT